MWGGEKKVLLAAVLMQGTLSRVGAISSVALVDWQGNIFDLHRRVVCLYHVVL